MPRKKVKTARSTTKTRANSKSKCKGKKGAAKHGVARKAAPTKFLKFPSLPAELREEVIQAAIAQHEENRGPHMVLFDDKTRRISPILDLAQSRCPILYVNREFRTVALQTYMKIQVLLFDPPGIGHYGPEEDWYSEGGELQYSAEIALQIDQEARQAAEDGELKGFLYVNLKKDLFIIGSVPIQIAMTDSWYARAEMVNKDCYGPFNSLCFYISEPLATSVCANICKMCELVWDPVSICDVCDGYHAPCCSLCFFAGRGGVLDPRYETNVFPSIKEYGYYVMGGDLSPENFIFEIGYLGSKKFLKDQEWQQRYVCQDYNIPSRMRLGNDD